MDEHPSKAIAEDFKMGWTLTRGCVAFAAEEQSTRELEDRGNSRQHAGNVVSNSSRQNQPFHRERQQPHEHRTKESRRVQAPAAPAAATRDRPKTTKKALQRKSRHRYGHFRLESSRTETHRGHHPSHDSRSDSW